MMKLATVVLTVFVVATLVFGAALPARAAIISTAQEIQIGQQAAAQLEAEVGVVPDPALNASLTSIGLRLAQVSDRPTLPWTFKVLNTDKVNAISLPGGFIYVTRGMMNFVRSQDELAFVVAHEIGHVVRRHHIAVIERDFFFSIVLSLIFGGNPNMAQIGNLARELADRGFSRGAEFEADVAGTTLAHKAGFNAGAGLTFMERLRTVEGSDPTQFEVFLSTHPALAERITRVRELLRRLGYNVVEVVPGSTAAQVAPVPL